MSERVQFLDLTFDAISSTEVEHWLATRSEDSGFAYLVTPNVDHMVRFAEAPDEVRRAYRRADLMICDSRVLARLARFAGVVLSVVPGSDLVAALFGKILAPGDRICLIGGLAEDAARLGARFPEVVIVHHAPPWGLRNNPVARGEAAEFAESAAARFILLAVGSPQQEMLAFEIAERGTAKGTALCIGASVDFLTGSERRAPRLLQRAGLEWAWRLGSNPRRLAGRYLVQGPRIFPMIWRWRRLERRRSK